jgi:hypothetical protein
MNKTNIGLVSYVKTKLGCPYWYGTFGQIGSASLLKAKIKQYPKYYTQSRIDRCTKQYGEQVFDCVGLIKSYLWEKEGKIGYIISQDVSANGMLDKCKEKGTIKTLPEIPGVLLFMNGHVGVYIGNGYAIEATVGNNDYKVKKSKVVGRGWTSWGKCPYLDYIVEKPIVKPVENPTPTEKPKDKPVNNNIYFKKYTGKSVSIVDALVSVGAGHTFAYRRQIAKANGMKTYLGTPGQNTKLLNLLKAGKLIKPPVRETI